MGTYVNPGIERFRISRNSRFYVDKSTLLKVLNNKVNKKDRFICVSRPRRFGKTMAANMIAAYYSKGCDSHEREAEDVNVFHTYYFQALLFIHSTIILFSSGVWR